jgi:hypothetical protein
MGEAVIDFDIAEIEGAEAQASGEAVPTDFDDETRVFSRSDVDAVAETAGERSADAILREDITKRLGHLKIALEEPRRIPVPLLQHMETVVVDGVWITDESVLREVMYLTVVSLDPNSYREKRKEFMEFELEHLVNIFLLEMAKKKIPSAGKLGKTRPNFGASPSGRVIPPPLPAPPSSRPFPPLPSPPRAPSRPVPRPKKSR